MIDFESKFGKCPMYYTMSAVEGKWKWIILWEIYKAEVIRYNKLREELQPIAHKTLSKQLKELETSKLIHREQYNEVPPKVEYSLTNEGKTLIPILELMYQWGEKHIPKKE
ncbi:putative regulatory protein MalR [Clostridium pasteurianum DSM 525 = ATCC 6013]|uniref:Putative regulatory protein MalR n=1 Tax=Clostridium pasteurianum DSM 525 = ATCC 6013 TaxID=1262449 RepID=A0A0H3J4E9_CLOPA|nr:helix-turn-helix domain-containing protein [Clostridium pasteurianum]AJA48816.1 putative regulatory protein MalR [Clostridium pasteurianum DSM 525 = ATCC 6013]AJA52804.1 putative regulatory protein MalR [Clostridium pasteurianum DSM 525 = ATCC 6013]AOZ76029.1 HxlR family transcriptional regulator [Clostridium pasteurianum DSM 525 = ATCC 6013]AOZ79825.1 HxlR family transcriptional regulator [Clostridium pasteurianum]ELP60111.1 HxlR family transcriptional regulator [Clostridium pasteurianum D